MTSISPFTHWRDSLQQWQIPAEILKQAPESPWIHPVELFDVRGVDDIPDSPSHRAARAALGSSLLDVGCGGGKAAFACVPPATHLIGVDSQRVMLERFAAAAKARGVECSTFLGEWPYVSAGVPVADVVTCHNVFYNVPELEPFVRALTEHARRRVVVELPTEHPLSDLKVWWQHFWGIDRPDGPTAADAAECVRWLGHDVHVEEGNPVLPSSIEEADAVRYMRIRLCLPAERDDEVREFMRAQPPRARTNVTLWWDVPR